MVKISLYDFDRTIYSKDTGVEILKHIAKKKTSFWLYIPQIILALLGYLFHLYPKKKLKQIFFSPLAMFTQSEWDIFIQKFWNEEKTNLFKNVIEQMHLDKKNGYVIGVISASAEIFLSPLKTELPADFFIGTRLKSNKYISSELIGDNCKNSEKVVRLIEYTNTNYPDQKIEFSKMYSDSLHDLPLFRITKEHYTIEKNGDIRKGLPLPNKNI